MKVWAMVVFVLAMALTGWAQTLSTKDGLQITFSPDGSLGEFGSPRSNLSVSAASSSLNRPKRPKNFNGHL